MRNGFLICAAVVLVGASVTTAGTPSPDPWSTGTAPTVAPAPGPSSPGQAPVERVSAEQEAAEQAPAEPLLPGMAPVSVPLNPNAPVLHPEAAQAEGAEGDGDHPEESGHETSVPEESAWKVWQGHGPILACSPVQACFWGSVDYLLWKIKDSALPPLVTTGSSTDARPGALGQPGTEVLNGGQDTHNLDRSGGRVTLGYWFYPYHQLGIDGSYLNLASRTVRFTSASAGDTVLARPFFDVRADQEDAQLVAFPGLQSGSVHTELSSRLWGAESNLRTEVMCGGWYDLCLLAGFRYLQLNEGLVVSSQDVASPPNGALGPSSSESVDIFGTRSSFYGGQLGFDGGFQVWLLSVDVVGKIALGSTEEVGTTSGTTVNRALTTGVVSTIPSGMLILPSNTGHFVRDQFTVVPEIAVNLGYEFNQHVRATVGFTYLYWDHVFRPGDQVDRVLNVTQIQGPAGGSGLIGPARPTYPAADTDFWAYGVSLGLEFRY